MHPRPLAREKNRVSERDKHEEKHRRQEQARTYTLTWQFWHALSQLRTHGCERALVQTHTCARARTDVRAQLNSWRGVEAKRATSILRHMVFVVTYPQLPDFGSKYAVDVDVGLVLLRHRFAMDRSGCPVLRELLSTFISRRWKHSPGRVCYEVNLRLLYRGGTLH